MSLYTPFVQEHYRHPRNLGILPDATHHARTLRGDAMMEFHLRVAGETIEAVTFRAIGCAGTVAAGSAMTEWLVGRRVVTARAVTAQTVLGVLGELPEERRYCADFAARAIRATLRGMDAPSES